MFQLLSTMDMPPFHASFSEAVRTLDAATQMTPTDQREAFGEFLRNYGTHYLTETVFGAKVSHTQKYSERTTQRVSKETLQECATE